jgi:protein ImuB
MMFACIHSVSADLPQIAAAFSPSFEQTAPDTVVFRVDGLRRLHGSPQQIAQAIAQQSGDDVNVAIAETADAAILAARNFPGVTVAPNLNDLDVSTLPLTDEMAQVFDSWGIYTVEQLAQLPETGLAERFGPHGVYLQQLARGVTHRPLKIFQPETTYEDRIELDHPVSLLEPLLFLIARLLNEQCARLLSNAMAANEVTIRLELEDRNEHTRTLHLPVPMRESKSLLKLLQMDLEAHPPTAPTVALALALKPVHPRTV